MGAIPTRVEMAAALAARHGAVLQERLSAARVAVCGLGGLGSNVAIALARAGVGTLHLVDFDRVDLSNLNRQQYTVAQLGQFKTEALRETLAAIAPYCDVETTTMRLTAENIPDILSADPIVCEAFDRAEAKAMLVDAIQERWPDRWLVCGSGMAGLQSANLIRTRRLGRRMILCGDGVSDVAEAGSLVSARVLACAAHEALAIIRIIAGTPD